jgi:hypothetical protein
VARLGFFSSSSRSGCGGFIIGLAVTIVIGQVPSPGCSFANAESVPGGNRTPRLSYEDSQAILLDADTMPFIDVTAERCWQTLAGR